MKKLAALLSLLAVASLPAFGATTGTIRGTVSDPTGASVPGASVEMIQGSTGYARTASTGPQGTFLISELPPGLYNLTISKAGFKVFSLAGINLHVGEVYVVPATLQVGPTSQRVTVQAAPIQADITTMQLGADMVGGPLTDLPTLNRNWVALQQTIPGVVASSDRFANDFATNGNRTQSNDYLINGADANDLPLNTPVDIPSPDAIQEVKVVTNTLNPEYGRNSGAILNAVTKSGSNAWHGSAFEYFRDTGLDARNFFSAKTPPPFHQNQFGGTVGGPVKHNKAFFFFSYQGTRTRSGGVNNTPVFSQGQRSGDWSAQGLGSSTGVSPFPLFGDSASPCPVSGGSKCPAGTAYGRLFTTGVVPTQDFSSVAANLMSKFVPLANTGATTFSFPSSNTSHPDQYIGRGDLNLGSSDRLFGYVFAETNATSETLPFIGANLPGFGEVDKRNAYNFVLGETHIFNSVTLNEFRISYNRFNFDAVEPATPTLPASLGFTGITPQIPSGAGAPFVGITGFFNLGFSQDGPQPRLDDTGELVDNFSYLRGNHSYKFGIDFRRGHVENPFGFENNGAYFFEGSGTFTTGLPGADFELGIPDFYVQSSGGFIDARAWEYYSYIQDQWRIRPSFVLTYGIGWDIETPLADHANGCLAINRFNPFQQSTVFPTAPQGLIFPGDAGVSCSGYRTHYNNFAPRLGFAWSPSRSWTIRAGWGMYYNNSEEELTLQNLLAPPFALIDFGAGDVGLSPSFTQPFSSVNPTTVCLSGCGTSSQVDAPAGSIANKYPFSAPKAGAPVDFSFFEPFSLNVIDPNFNVPYNMNYNLTIQHQVTSHMLATLSYVGSQGRRLEGVFEQNPYNPAVCLATPGCPGARAVEFAFPGVGTKANASIFGSVGTQGTFTHSNYNALQVTVEQAPSHGLFFRGAYTYSHALDNSSSFENSAGTVIPSNFNLTYGDSAYDARHRFVLSAVYHAPRFRLLPKQLGEGWGIAAIGTFQTGFPIQLFESDFRSLQCTPVVSFYGCWDRPQVVGPLQIFGDPRSSPKHEFFNPSAFAKEALGTVGDAGRNFFHGPGINNWDLSGFKDFTITEEKKVRLRADLFNAFNHAQFANPVANRNSSRFGQILSTRSGFGRILQLSADFIF